MATLIKLKTFSSCLVHQHIRQPMTLHREKKLSSKHNVENLLHSQKNYRMQSLVNNSKAGIESRKIKVLTINF